MSISPSLGQSVSSVADDLRADQSDAHQPALSLSATSSTRCSPERTNEMVFVRLSNDMNTTTSDAYPTESPLRTNNFTDTQYTSPFDTNLGQSSYDTGAASNAGSDPGVCAKILARCRGRELSDDEWRRRRRRRYKYNKAVPIILICVIGYMTYVFCYLLAWKFLIGHGGSRKRIGIALMCVYLVLALSMIVYCAIINYQGPGYTEKNTADDNEVAAKHNEMLQNILSPPEGFNTSPGQEAQNDDPTNAEKRALGDDTKNDNDMPEAFICESDGYPLWCSRCRAPKPDRAHHSSEVDRCVLKMDHYCPWVGSLIGFRNYKAFVLFVLSCLGMSLLGFFTLLIYTVKHARENKSVNPQFIVIDTICGFFMILLIPFTYAHALYILRNTATIEHLNRNYREYAINIAVDPEQPHIRAVVHSEIGMRLWDLGPWENWKSIMGKNIWEWFLPWDTTHQDGRTFKYNPEIIRNFRESLKQQGQATTGNDDSGRFIVMRKVRNI